MYQAMRLLILLLPSICAWRPETSPPLAERKVLNLVASGHMQAVVDAADGSQRGEHEIVAPKRQLVSSNLVQLAETASHMVEIPTGAEIEKEAVNGEISADKCAGAVDVLTHLLQEERHIEVACVIGGTLAFLISLVCVGVWVGMRVKPPPPHYWNNGAHCCCSCSNDFDDEVDVTDELLPVVQKLVDMTTAPHLLGKGHDASWQTHKRFKVLQVIRIESGRHWTQYATALKVTQPFAHSLQQMPDELRKRTEEGWKKIIAEHAERENDPVVGKFLRKLGLDRSRNEIMLFHGSPLAGARNKRGEIIFPTEAQAPMNAIKKTGFDERLGNAKGMVGAGTYFADYVAKADSYAGRYNIKEDGQDPGSVGEKAAMFLSRVAIGCPYITNQSLEQLRRPPCLQGHFDANLVAAEVQHGEPWNKKGLDLEVCEHARCDAVIAEPPMIDNHPWATDFREFVLYEKRCYPEFLFYYERLDDE